MKRLFDVFASGCGLLVLSPIFLIMAIWIKLDSEGSVFYRQVRVGRNNNDFRIFKFRSMRVGADKQGLITVGGRDPRITCVGYFIRKYKLDELPQLFNVLKGDMSLVGTRPPTVDEFEQYSAYHKKRLCQKPGLTGVWQVSGRSTITDFEEIVQMDVDYIDHWSIWRDIGILFKTVWLVVCGDDGAQ